MGGRGSRAAPALRRQPKRASSEEIVRSILDAAALLLDRDGIRGLTTNAVARVAGVSVGSLYQYFPDNKAIVAELARGLEATAMAMAAEEAVRLARASAREATARVIALSCSPRFGTAKLRRILLREVPRGWIVGETRSTDALVGAAITELFRARPAEVRQPSLARSIFVAQHAVEGIVEAVLLAHPDVLATEPVHRELFHVAWAYIASDGAPLDRLPIERIEEVEVAQAPSAAVAARLLEEPFPRIARERKRATSARALATRPSLLDAAERVLAREGFSGLSVRAVVADAGCSVGAFYRHFASPLALAAELAIELEQRAAATLEGALASARDPRDLSAALVDAYASETVAAFATRRALLAEIPRRATEEAVTEAVRGAVEHLSRALERSASELRQDGPEMMAFFALHAVKSATEAFVLLRPDGIDASALARELRDLVLCYWTRPRAGRALRPEYMN